jgi:hypothetical protein
MYEFPQRDLEYVIRLDEVFWGGVLLAVTIAIHGIGMLLTVTAGNALRGRFERARSRYPAVGLSIIILAAWMIVLVNLIEVMIWAGFYVWKGAQPNPFSAFYNALLNYTTLQAGYLPPRWRLLEGMLGISGLLTFAWSTSVLFSLAQEFQEKALLVAKQRWEKRHAERSAVKPHRSGNSDGT